MPGQMALAKAKLDRWRAYPVEMVVEEFGVTPDPWQAEALTAFAERGVQRLGLRACKGPGKTSTLAWLILNFLATRPSPKIICTSITEANLDTNLWPELDKWMSRSAFFRAAFQWTKTRVQYRADPNNWFAVARSWPKQANAEQQADALAGVHADHVMGVIDESGGVPQAIMATLEAILSSCIEGKLVQAGNPTHTTGPLYRACTLDAHLWRMITITGDPDNPRRSSRISLEWAQQQIASYGRDNPWVKVNVLGEFPDASINALLGVEEVQAAMDRHLRKDQYDWAQKRLGVDVARFGDDRTVIFPRQGMAAFRPVVLRHLRTTDIAARVAQCRRDWGSEMELIDDTGHWGHGVLDNLLAAGIPSIGINFAGKALNPRYRNRRAEMWLEGAKMIKGGGALPKMPEMIGELTEPTYTFINGVFVLEEKDQIKERLGRSPDLADAYMLTHAMPDQPGQVLAALTGRTTTLHEFDPYAVSPAQQRDYNPFEER